MCPLRCHIAPLVAQHTFTFFNFIQHVKCLNEFGGFFIEEFLVAGSRKKVKSKRMPGSL
jgi:hypothetical protein